MIKTIDFAGIELDNYTVREMIMNVEKDMSDHGFHTIEEVNMDTLMLPKRKPGCHTRQLRHPELSVLQLSSSLRSREETLI